MTELSLFFMWVDSFISFFLICCIALLTFFSNNNIHVVHKILLNKFYILSQCDILIYYILLFNHLFCSRNSKTTIKIQSLSNSLGKYNAGEVGCGRICLFGFFVSTLLLLKTWVAIPQNLKADRIKPFIKWRLEDCI